MHNVNDPDVWSEGYIYEHNLFEEEFGSKSNVIVKCIKDDKCKRNKPLLAVKNYKRHYIHCCCDDQKEKIPKNNMYPLFILSKQDDFSGYEWCKSAKRIMERESHQQKRKKQKLLQRQQSFMTDFFKTNKVCIC